MIRDWECRCGERRDGWEACGEGESLRVRREEVNLVLGGGVLGGLENGVWVFEAAYSL